MNATRALLADPGLARVLVLLNGDGEEARVVGGAVRNALMGRPHTDHDVTTTAVPEVVIARARAAGLRTVPTGIAHGTVTVLVEGRPFEVTTLREDVETDGRHAVIRFGRDFAQDAMRRDFTINALSVDVDGRIHDYTGGLDDLAAERVRFIGDPATRIREDYLRTLRFFRFSAEYAVGDLDAAGLAATVAQRDGLARLSRERVRQELLKLVVARRASEATAAMSEAGLLGPLLAGVAQPFRLARLARIAPETGAIPRLAALGVIVREDAERLRERLKLSNAEAARLATAAEALARQSSLPENSDPCSRASCVKCSSTTAAPARTRGCFWLGRRAVRRPMTRAGRRRGASSPTRRSRACRSPARTSSPAASQRDGRSARRSSASRPPGSAPASRRIRMRWPNCWSGRLPMPPPSPRPRRAKHRAEA